MRRRPSSLADRASVFVLMIVLYIYFTGLVTGAIVAALVMLVAGFFFATVSGYLVGLIGSSNNPISGLTLSTLDHRRAADGVARRQGMSGVVAVLGVAAVVCVSSAVAGELLQDFKVGYILGGTPRTIQIVELIARRAGEPRHVLPAAGRSIRATSTSGRDGFGDPQPLGAAGRPDGVARAGHRGRRHGVAAGRRRHRAWASR